MSISGAHFLQKYCGKDCRQKAQIKKQVEKKAALSTFQRATHCSECGGKIPKERSPKSLTCSDRCRSKRGAKKRIERIERQRQKGKTCEYAGCEKPAFEHPLCTTHRYRKQSGKDMSAPFVNDKKLVGYERTDLRGYIHIKTENGWKAKHRHVMAIHIGRPLLKDELVHHRNGDRADNRIENLELCRRFQPPGQRVKDQVAWCREFLDKYGDLADRAL